MSEPKQLELPEMPPVERNEEEVVDVEEEAPAELAVADAAPVVAVENARAEQEPYSDIEVAKILAATGRFGEAEEVYAKMQVARALGVSVPAALAHGIHDIEGRLRMHYTLLATLMRRHGYWYAIVPPEPEKEGEPALPPLNPKRIKVVLTRIKKDGTEEPVVNPVTGEYVSVTISMSDMVARKIATNQQGGLKSAWASYPERMMFSHAISTLVSLYLPFVLYDAGAEGLEIDEHGIKEIE